MRLALLALLALAIANIAAGIVFGVTGAYTHAWIVALSTAMCVVSVVGFVVIATKDWEPA